MSATIKTGLTPIPQVKGRPLIGNLLALREDRLKLFQRAYRECGDVASFKAGPRQIILLSSAELAISVLAEHASSVEKGPNFRAVSRPLLGEGLLTSLNEPHRRQRRLLAPAFQPRRLTGYAAVMTEHLERAALSWADGSTIDVAAEMTKLTLGIAGRTLFGADVGDEAMDLGRELTVAVRHATAAMTSLFPLPLHWSTPQNRRTRRAISRLDATVYRMIEQRRQSGEDRDDVLSILLHARDEEDGSKLSDKELRDQAMTLFLAGHETTANALSWSWYLLAQNPAVYERLRDEATKVLGGRAPTYQDLPRLPYALLVLKESLRLYPPAFVMARQAMRELDLGPYRIPDRSLLLISPYVLHHRADYFPDPERFNPERFAGEAEKNLPRGAYLPFGIGPRNCIGTFFALTEAQLVLAGLAQRVMFELVPGQRIETEPLITLRPKSAIRMVVRRATKVSQ